MFKYLRTIGIVAISVFMVASCSGPGEIHEYSVSDLEFSLEGPLFAGPNSGQAEIAVDLAEALGDAYVDGMRISDARLTSATVAPNDSLGFANINAFVVAFASDNEDISMQEEHINSIITSS